MRLLRHGSSGLVLLGLTAALALAAGILAAPGDGAGRAPRFADLGLMPRPPAPACPANCRAIGRVTGFQVRSQDRDENVTRLPFRVPFDGEATFWTINLAQPTDSQRAYFNRTFGGSPRARLAVLRHVPRSSPPRYRLLRQGRPRYLTGYLGRRVRFPLNPPLPVARGDIIALTVPTWAPAFAVDLPEGNRWRASRRPGSCRRTRDLQRGRSHQIPRTGRPYGCVYETARLLYSARVVRG